MGASSVNAATAVASLKSDSPSTSVFRRGSDAAQRSIQWPAALDSAFAPPEIAEIGAQLVISAPEQQLTWTFPIRGIAEAPPSDRVLEFECQARTGTVERLSLVLPGMPALAQAETFTHELVLPEDAKLRDLVEKSVSIAPITTTIRDNASPVEFDVRFEPMRPFTAAVQFIVNKASGGRWRYEMKLIASEAEPDDTIVIEAMLNHTSSVSFELTNQFPTYAPFQVRAVLCWLCVGSAPACSC